MDAPTLQEVPTSPSDVDRAAPAEPIEVAEPELVESELLVEEVSIDGMCGVY